MNQCVSGCFLQWALINRRIVIIVDHFMLLFFVSVHTDWVHRRMAQVMLNYSSQRSPSEEILKYGCITQECAVCIICLGGGVISCWSLSW